MKKRVAVLISGRGSNMAALIEAAKAQDYPAEIVLVVSNRPEASGLAARAKQASRPPSSITRRSARIAKRSSARSMRELRAHRIDIVCLAGFMRLLTPWFVTRWSGRMLNIHPALLPQFKGLDTHRRALEAGVKEPRRDGPLRRRRKWMQVRSSCRSRCRCAKATRKTTLAARVLEVEHRIYPQALRLVAEGRPSPRRSFQKTGSTGIML